MNIDLPEITPDGMNVTASLLLDDHHEAVGVSEYGDDVLDTCGVCGFGVGWLFLDGADNFGHATGCGVETVQRWRIIREESDR